MRRLVLLLLPCACTPLATREDGSMADLGRATPPAADAGWRESQVLAFDPGADAELGFAAAMADLDGDGHADLILGSHQDADLGAASGSVYLAPGTSLGAGEPIKLLAEDGLAEDRFGAAVASPGDLDRDGRAELAVGAWGVDAGGIDAGAVYLFAGAAGLVDEDSVERLQAADASADARFGIALAGAGDLDGDGLPELAVGASGDLGMGAVYLYSAEGGGLDAGSEQKLVPGAVVAGDDFGSAVSAAGDLDGDGYGDLVAGAPTHDPDVANAGAAFTWYGGAGGVGGAMRLTARAPGANDGFGKSVAGVGDIDADGFDDLVVGAYQDDDLSNNGGGLHLFYGAADGVGPSSNSVYTSTSTEPNGFLGSSVVGAGDVDDDGFADMLAGAPGATVDGVSGGSALLYYGDADGFERTRTLTFTPSDGANADRFGKAVAAGQDVDGDGLPDLLIGAYAHGGGAAEAGAAYLYLSPCEDRDADGFCGALDCLDTDRNTYPGAASLESGSACMTDRDGDGWGESSPAAGVEAGQDCLDSDAGVFPGAASRESSSACMRDADDDGWGAPEPGEGITPGSDCDDADAATAPGAAPQDSTTACMTDGDGDGFGSQSPAGTAVAGSDCQDGDGDSFPGAAEAEDATACMTDRDADGWGSASPLDAVTAGTDCDDQDEARNPGLSEACNGVDDDCDEQVDDDPVDGVDFFADADGDGWTSAEDLVRGCEAPEGYGGASYLADCDDADAGVSPGAAELAGDGIDQDCDGADASWDEGGGKGCSALPAIPGLLPLLLGLLPAWRRRARQ